MPIVRIDIQSGKTTEYKRTLLHGVRDAIVTELGVPSDRVMQRIIETPREDIDATEVRSDRLTIVEISMLPRAASSKRSSTVRSPARLGVEPGIAQHDLSGAGERSGCRVLLPQRPDAVRGRRPRRGAAPISAMKRHRTPRRMRPTRPPRAASCDRGLRTAACPVCGGQGPRLHPGRGDRQQRHPRLGYRAVGRGAGRSSSRSRCSSAIPTSWRPPSSSASHSCSSTRPRRCTTASRSPRSSTCSRSSTTAASTC